MDCISSNSNRSSLYYVKKSGDCIEDDKMLNSLFGKPKNRKGALTTQQIVLLIILIASFVVILYFFMSAELGEESEKEICHNSVVMKSKASMPGDTELNCERTYLCITEDGSCEGMSKPKKEEVESLEEVYEILSQEMAECWWMFGEGKINYIGKKEFQKNYCSICSQILFDDSLNNLEGVEDGRIDKDELYEYMKNHSISISEGQKQESKSYAEYILGTNNLTRLKEQIMSHENYSSDKEPSFGEITIGKEYYVVMGITSEVTGAWKIVGGTLAVAGVVSLAIPGVNIATGAIIIGGASAGVGGVAEMINPEIGAITVQGEGIDNQFMAPTIVEAESEKFEALNCEETVTYA